MLPCQAVLVHLHFKVSYSSCLCQSVSVWNRLTSKVLIGHLPRHVKFTCNFNRWSFSCMPKLFLKTMECPSNGLSKILAGLWSGHAFRLS